MAPNKLTLSAHEVAEVLGVSLLTVRRRIADGTLPAVRIGRRIVVPRAALERWLDSEADARTAAAR